MRATPKPNRYQWLSAGDEIFPALLAAIRAAQKTIRLEVYTFAGDELGRSFRDALVLAQQRGARVQVLIDAFGSIGLSENFWHPLQQAGGEVRWFNPVLLKRLSFRDHRKLLVCDEEVAFIGGFNIAKAYAGDGVTSGWCDLGLEVTSPLAVQLAAAFDEMFTHATSVHYRFARPAHSSVKRGVTTDAGTLLLSGPGGGYNPFKRALGVDLQHASNVRIIAAYFLPTFRIRRDLKRIARRGGSVQLMLPAKSDVFLSQLATGSLYRRMLKAGIEIYEYQPQVLHAKLIIIDDLVYAGSSNLDPRSLHLNYEVMLRLENKKLVAQARELFAGKLAHCLRIELAVWGKSRRWWNRVKERWAYFIITRVDPLIARWGPRHRRK